MSSRSFGIGILAPVVNADSIKPGNVESSWGRRKRRKVGIPPGCFRKSAEVIDFVGVANLPILRVNKRFGTRELQATVVRLGESLDVVGRSIREYRIKLDGCQVIVLIGI